LPRITGLGAPLAAAKRAELWIKLELPTRADLSVHSTRPGPTSLFPGGRPARPSICVRNSSRKRTQSARKSSETNSPGGSNASPSGLSGCCFGSGDNSRFPVETVDNSWL
jgi:hypothetical protein